MNLVIIHINNNLQISVDISECEGVHDILDTIVSQMGEELDPDFAGSYEVIKRDY
tara:strand:+ start:241 stop:405 length:165 start_codon:yes stop_codon:yes gene_type:complete